MNDLFAVGIFQFMGNAIKNAGELCRINAPGGFADDFIQRLTV